MPLSPSHPPESNPPLPGGQSERLVLPAGLLERSRLGLRFVTLLVMTAPGFLSRAMNPPQFSSARLRLWGLVRSVLEINLLVTLVTGALMGRLLNGGLVLSGLQSLTYLFGAREPLLNLTVAHILPSIVVLMLIARGGMAIAVRTAVLRSRGRLKAIDSSLEPEHARVMRRWVWPRVVGSAAVAGLLCAVGLVGLALGFVVEPTAVRAGAGVAGARFQWDALRQLLGPGLLAESLLKAGLMGGAVGAIACFQGLIEVDVGTAVWKVVGRAFRAALIGVIVLQMLSLGLPWR